MGSKDCEMPTVDWIQSTEPKKLSSQASPEASDHSEQGSVGKAAVFRTHGQSSEPDRQSSAPSTQPSELSNQSHAG
jgi:hypothetical protein